MSVKHQNDSRISSFSQGDVAADQKKLAIPVGLGWAAGAVGIYVMSSVVSALVLKFSVDNLGLTAAIAGIIITVTRLFDAGIDPFMGTLSDRTQSRWGRRRPYLLIGGFLCALSPVILFGDPFSVALSAPAIYLTFALIIFSMAHTAFNVPHLTMSYEMTNSQMERTLLMSFRVYAMGLGAIVGASLGPWIITQYGGGLAGYAAMSWWLGGIILVACLIAFWATGFAPTNKVAAQTKKATLKDAVQAIHNRPFVSLVTAKSLYLFGTGVASSCYAFLITNVIKSDLATLGLMLSVMMGCMILVQPFWVWFTNRWGKRLCFIAAAPLNAMASASWFFVEQGEPMWAILARGAMIGLFGGGMALAIQAMLPDTLEHDVERTGIRQEGVLTGIFTTVERTISALGVAATGLILSIGGYVSGRPGGAQSEDAIMAIYIATSLVPAFCILGSIGLMSRYNLKG